MHPSYAIIWRRGNGPLYAGRLELADGGVHIDGVTPGRRARVHDIPFEEISSARVNRRRTGRLRGLPTITIELRRSAPLEVAAVDAPGRLTELAAALTSRLVAPAA